MAISADNLANEIAKELKKYTNDVKEQIEVDRKEVANTGVKMLKQNSPEETGDYAKGWRRKKVKTKDVIHNATDYQLTHLLEKGHANRDGSRTPAQPHIAPVEAKVVEEFVKRVEKSVEG